MKSKRIEEIMEYLKTPIKEIEHSKKIELERKEKKIADEMRDTSNDSWTENYWYNMAEKEAIGILIEANDNTQYRILFAAILAALCYKAVILTENLRRTWKESSFLKKYISQIERTQLFFPDGYIFTAIETGGSTYRKYQRVEGPFQLAATVSSQVYYALREEKAETGSIPAVHE